MFLRVQMKGNKENAQNGKKETSTATTEKKKRALQARLLTMNGVF